MHGPTFVVLHRTQHQTTAYVCCCVVLCEWLIGDVPGEFTTVPLYPPGVAARG
jgi:hypothetical protein